MKRRLRRLSRSVAPTDAASTTPGSPAFRQLRSKTKSKPAVGGGGGGVDVAGPVPAGHVPVRVGEEGGPVERFAVRAELLGEPPFAALLRRAEQEYGYAHPGALRIPCSVDEFRRLVIRLS